MSRVLPIRSAAGLLVACIAIAGCGSEGVAGAPIAADDRATTGRDVPVALSLIANDTAGPTATLDVGSLDLDLPTPGAQQRIVTDADDYILDCLGDVRFIPALGFSGEATTPYTIADSLGQVSAPARIIIAVEAD